MGEASTKNRKKIIQRTLLLTIGTLIVLTSVISLIAYNQSQTAASQYRTLQNSYDSLQSQISVIQINYNNLTSQYNKLKINYDNLTSQYNKLMSSHNMLLESPGLTYDITDYGATPNDQSDDVLAFVKILSEHPSNIQIHIPSGTFLIGTAIQLNKNDNVTIFGEGINSIIKLTAQNNIISIENSKNVVIKDLIIDGNNGYLTGTEDCIRAGFHADDLILQKLYIHDTIGNSIHIFASSNAIIDNCRVENSGKIGINSHLYGNAIILNSVDGARITGNLINGYFGDNGIGVVRYISEYLGRNTVIYNNTVSGAHTDEGSGIGIGFVENCIITNNVVFNDNDIYDSKDKIFEGIDGIYLVGEKNIVINKNEIYRVTGVGIEINNGDNVIAINNYLHDFVGNGTSAAGMYVSANNTLVENNTIEDATSHGLSIGNYGNNEQIINNTIRDTRAVLFKDSGGIRILLDELNKKNLTIIDNTLINNPWGIYFTTTGLGQLIDPIIRGNTIIGSNPSYFGVEPTN